MKWHTFFLFLLFSDFGFGQAANPIIKCVQRNTSLNTITWQNPIVPCGPIDKTYVYVSTSPSGPFILLDSSNTNSYIHTPIVQGNTYYYCLVAKYNCPSPLSGFSDTFQDTRIPGPNLRSISIENGNIVYSWDPIPNRKEIYGYPIIIPSTILDTVLTRTLSTTYIDINYNPSSGPYQGAIAAMDSCGGINGRSGFFYQITSFLSINSNPCNGTINLSWTKYKGWDATDQTGGYEILVTKNQDPEKVIVKVTQDVTAFIYSDFVFGDTITIRVRAIHPTDINIVSHTNSYTIISKKAVKPEIFHGISASYLNNNQVKISWYMDKASRPKSFTLHPYNLKTRTILPKIENAPFFKDDQGRYFAIDNQASSSVAIRYAIKMIDSCFNEYDGVPVATCYLNAEQIGQYRNELKWKEDFFPDSVAYTILSRVLEYSTDGGVQFNSVPEYDGLSLSFKHDLRYLANNFGRMCYRLRLTYKIDTASEVRDSIREIYSQTACLALRTILWVPTAFKVDGVTPQFKPMLIFHSSSDFEMKIFTRWGQEVFQTKDHNQGWNGIFQNGTRAPEDNYMYIIRYTGNDGVEVTKTGNFVLLR